MAVWITVDVDLWKHPKMAALPSDSARWGWLVTLSEAKQQRKPGTFASARHYREVVGRFARYLTVYLEGKLLDKAADGVLQVHDWRKHQWSVAQTTKRQRDDVAMTTGGQQEDASRAVPVPVYVSVLETGGESPERGDDEPEFPLLQWLAQHGCYITPGNGYHRHLVTAVERHGAKPMLAMFERLSRAGTQDGDVKTFVFDAIDALRTKPDLRALDAEDEAEEERKRKAGRDERSAANLAYLRGDFPSFAEALAASREAAK